MGDGKKDLTRIEDLGEFLHELSADDLPPDLPPSEDDTTLSNDPFGGSDDFPPPTPGDDVPPLEFSTDDFSSEGPPAADFVMEDSSSEDLSGPLAPVFGQEEEATPLQADEAAPADDPAFAAEGPSFSGQEDLEEPLPAPEVGHQAVPNPAPALAPASPPREDFADVRAFAEHAVLADVSAACNPAFSVIARDVKFLEDREEILALLRELAFPADLLTQFRRQLERGTLLVPRVSEYAAIHICHKLRRFRLELEMGPSDLVHAPRAQDDADKGLVSRRSLGQNQQHQFRLQDKPADARQVLLSTLPQLEGHTVERYLGVASEHAFLDASVVEDEAGDSVHTRYEELAQRLKAHALEKSANAVVGISYQLTPLPPDPQSLGHMRYKLTCTGNVVWVARHA